MCKLNRNMVYNKLRNDSDTYTYANFTIITFCPYNIQLEKIIYCYIT